MTTTGLSPLIATIESLEKRLWGSSAEALSDPDRIEGVLSAIAQKDHAQFLEKKQGLRHRFDLVDRVRARLKPIAEETGAKQIMSLQQAAILQYTEDLFQSLFLSDGLDLSVFPGIHAMPAGIARLLLRDPDALEDPQGAPRRFCERLIESVQGYDRQAGRLADTLVQRLEGVLYTTLVGGTEAAPIDGTHCETALTQLTKVLGENEQSAQRFVQYLISKERGDASRGDARQLVNQAILEAVAGRRVPIVFVQFLAKVWSKYLFVTYLREGTQSEEWKHGIQDIRILADGLSTQDPNEVQPHSELAQTLGRFRVAAGTIYGDPELSERFFETIDRVLQDIRAGVSPSAEYMTVAYEEGLGGEREGDMLISEQDRQLLESLPVGGWFRLTQGREIRRCRLVERNPDHQYCLFANLSGIKVARKDFSETAQALASGRLVRLLEASALLEQALQQADKRLRRQVERLEAKVQERERRLREKRAERARIQEEARRQEEREAVQRQEEEIQREEEEARDQREEIELPVSQEPPAQDDREAESPESPESPESKEHLDQDRDLQRELAEVQKLQLGASLEIVDPVRGRIDCKLGLKLRSSGKMVFVDYLGRRVLELLPEELAARLADGNAGILDYGVTFEDALQRLTAERDR